MRATPCERQHAPPSPNFVSLVFPAKIILPWFSAMRFGDVPFRLLSLNGASVQDGVKGQHVGQLQCFAHLELPQRGGPALRVFSKPA